MSSDLSLELANVHAAVTRWFTDETHQGFFATDARFRIVTWNRWMEIHSGHTASEIVGHSLFDIYHDAVARGIKECYESALAGRVTVVSHLLHRYILPFKPTNADLTLAEMPQSGHIGPLSHDGTVIGTITSLERSGPSTCRPSPCSTPITWNDKFSMRMYLPSGSCL